MKKLIWVFLFLLLATAVNAHQPRLVNSTHNVIEQPEVSKVYYGTLKGEPHFYKIDTQASVVLYLNIMSPYPDGKTNYNVTVQKDDEIIARLEGDWKKYFEEFGNDDYYKGPEYKAFLEPGTYIIKVSNPPNSGEYALAVGQEERYPPSEVLNAIMVLPQVKRDFFGKPAISAYNNFLGIVLVGFFIIFAFLVYLMFLTLRVYLGYR